MNALWYYLQRVPITEKSGRVHTSAASVVILPQANEVTSCRIATRFLSKSFYILKLTFD